MVVVGGTVVVVVVPGVTEDAGLLAAPGATSVAETGLIASDAIVPVVDGTPVVVVCGSSTLCVGRMRTD